MQQHKDTYLLIGFSSVALLLALFIAPIPQHQSYFQFADQNTILSIPHMWNVITNIPFIVIGVYGMVKLNALQREQVAQVRLFAMTFFIAMFFTGFGSAYFHWNPNNFTLFWDRLPLAINFMSFFSLIIALHIDPKIAKRSFWPLILIGMLSVIYWIYSEQIGKGDLRFYALVQFLPIVIIPIMLIRYKRIVYNVKFSWLTIGIYMLAKICEHFDHFIYDHLKFSGHSLKHLVAAVSAITVLMLVKSISFSNGDQSNSESKNEIDNRVT